MKSGYFLAALLLVPALVSAQSANRIYLNAPLAKQLHLPFSSGGVVGNTLYIAGTTGVDPTTKGSVTPSQEARLVMERIKSTVERAGMTMDDVVSVQVFCTNLHDYDAFNNVYRTYFHRHYPARAFIGAANLLFGARFEVMGIAVRSR